MISFLCSQIGLKIEPGGLDQNHCVFSSSHLRVNQKERRYCMLSCVGSWIPNPSATSNPIWCVYSKFRNRWDSDSTSLEHRTHTTSLSLKHLSCIDCLSSNFPKKKVYSYGKFTLVGIHLSHTSFKGMPDDLRIGPLTTC